MPSPDFPRAGNRSRLPSTAPVPVAWDERVRLLILSMRCSQEYLRQTLATGVDGYLLKEDADLALYSAIEAIRAGKTFVSPLLDE